MPNFFVAYFNAVSAKWEAVNGPEADLTWLTSDGASARATAAVARQIQGKYAAFPRDGADRAFLQSPNAVADGNILFTSKYAGTHGNAFRVAIVVAGNNTALSVSVSGNDITINSATNGSGVATSTATAVIAAVTASTPASALITAAPAAGNTGAGIVVAFPLTNLAHGTTGAVNVGVDTFQTTTIDAPTTF